MTNQSRFSGILTITDILRHSELSVLILPTSLSCVVVEGLGTGNGNGPHFGWNCAVKIPSNYSIARSVSIGAFRRCIYERLHSSTPTSTLNTTEKRDKPCHWYSVPFFVRLVFTNHSNTGFSFHIHDNKHTPSNTSFLDKPKAINRLSVRL